MSFARETTRRFNQHRAFGAWIEQACAALRDALERRELPPLGTLDARVRARGELLQDACLERSDPALPPLERLEHLHRLTHALFEALLRDLADHLWESERLDWERALPSVRSPGGLEDLVPLPDGERGVLRRRVADDLFGPGLPPAARAALEGATASAAWAGAADALCRRLTDELGATTRALVFRLRVDVTVLWRERLHEAARGAFEQREWATAYWRSFGRIVPEWLTARVRRLEDDLQQALGAWALEARGRFEPLLDPDIWTREPGEPIEPDEEEAAPEVEAG